eukprot:210980-Pleurochrysis_carterae.AAC.1
MFSRGAVMCERSGEGGVSGEAKGGKWNDCRSADGARRRSWPWRVCWGEGKDRLRGAGQREFQVQRRGAEALRRKEGREWPLRQEKLRLGGG